PSPEEPMPASNPPLLLVMDRAPRFRRQLVEAIRNDGGEAYGVESVRQALRLLHLFPWRFRGFLDLGPRAAIGAMRLRAHPQVIDVEVLSSPSSSHPARTPKRRSRRPDRQREISGPEEGCSSEGTVIHGARAKQVAITKYPRAHGQAGC